MRLEAFLTLTLQRGSYIFPLGFGYCPSTTPSILIQASVSSSHTLTFLLVVQASFQRSKMEHDYIPQFPPPPYSESDMGTLNGAISQARNPLASPTSSVDETIYTPSYSPTASVHRSQTLGDDFDLASSSSAAAYFESRPPPRTQVSGTPEIHRIAITATTAPKDLAYSPAFLARDCTAQDVRTNWFLKSFLMVL